ncbi:MAG TPA: cation:proton antiporter, partial [bacterium]|nr:cation:proton antiporter [bacterium]
IKMPSVLGELAAGIIIGPYLLGGIGLGLPGLEQGLFGVQTNSLLSVSTELYGIATIASILLLFMAGLETDIDLFFQFSIAGLIIGIGGVLFSFLFGTLTGIYFCNLPFSDPRCLFLGVISAATSVGITTRILSEKKKLESPEGVTIMAGAVIDDVLSIIMLAIVLGFSLSIKHTGVAVIDWNEIYAITLKSIIVCAGFTALGIMYSSKISKALKTIKNHTVYSVMAFGMALLLASVFEQTGLAMIIGAYIMGLTLSKTDLHYELQERLAPLYGFFVPIFFTVMGMLINVRLMFDKDILILGLVFSAGAVLAKIIGCGLPSFFLKFNALGALRIGLGMVPRGEVALIVAGIGLSY